ncbi:MAG: four helix bundle protein [Bacteroidales bacterium]|nr:four helix bundle protein [Bacteroidales bacterium]MBN2756158.1 four helix bundle protein [Bacteroidales bacterium]
MAAYKISFNLSNYVWEIVINWDYFSKETVGKQFVRAVDSISANLAEGFRRYGKKDKIKFYRYSFGSLKESFEWNEKSKKRDLLLKYQYEYIFTELDKLPKEINKIYK